METFENKKLIAFTEDEIDNLCAMLNAAWLHYNEKAKKGKSGAEILRDLSLEYWRKLYAIKVGE